MLCQVLFTILHDTGPCKDVTSLAEGLVNDEARNIESSPLMWTKALATNSMLIVRTVKRIDEELDRYTLVPQVCVLEDVDTSPRLWSRTIDFQDVLAHLAEIGLVLDAMDKQKKITCCCIFAAGFKDVDEVLIHDETTASFPLEHTLPGMRPRIKPVMLKEVRQVDAIFVDMLMDTSFALEDSVSRKAKHVSFLEKGRPFTYMSFAQPPVHVEEEGDKVDNELPVSAPAVANKNKRARHRLL